MNVNGLIDAIVRQTTVLIAQLATTTGMRAPLVHVANQVFLDLVGELRSQGVGGKVIADMFGMALRTYHGRVRRLSESVTDRGRTLWEAVLAYVQDKQLVRRGEVLHRFRHDDEGTVRGVLNDLVESGMVFRSGRGDRTMYRAADPADLEAEDVDPVEATAAMVLVAINRFQPVTRADIADVVRVDEDELTAALARLEGDGRATRTARPGGDLWRCDECVIPFNTEVGWEAAVFDHYQALVTALCSKLRVGNTHARRDDAIGGSTYGLDVWAGHPLEDEVYGQLERARQAASELRGRVEAYNRDNPPPPDAARRIIYYVGQTVLEDEQEAPR